ncbi:hypothetical protein [Salmonella sp. 32020501-2019-00050]|uniref:hypothetical protein n=1 Tax=Salmonella sp. 32020501-2019-00050 TaxID=2819766 RepID=UPI001AAF840F|nr:hypothetical protein [Salmonella sp. 32020501-2019-00050]EDT6631064.1 hypothetical protein [Salmonella enterica subsp. enterica serovar Wandsworth]EDW6595328.1 hypothetical protein [Salmonella enterica]EDT6699385.1 hypothetical protein [Salmonella enterica subsp. enterica serovar Wandsworth]EDT6704388.1 hypothetical protein [Salmonella enterica subsp. enterica serovar Wandsworth]EDT6713925.1 hypothetical protein [Salmonella enterica subsp. enterica serovar Wandsworth]
MKTMVTVNKDTNTVYIDGERYALSTSEIMSLEFWHSNPGVIPPRQRNKKKCWTGRGVSYTSVPVAIKHIRDVFSANNGWRGIILTKKG